MGKKRLYKSRNKKLMGVCGGVAEYLGMDPTVMRIIWGLCAIFTGFAIPLYIIMAIVMDENPDNLPGGIEDEWSGQDFISEDENKYTYNFKKNNREKEPIDVSYREAPAQEYREEDEPVGFKVEDVFQNNQK